MIRPMLVVAATTMFAVEPTLPVDGDFTKYAITQGGLLCVVLVLLWSYRKDTLGTLQAERERGSILTDLVSSTRVALEKNAEAIATMARTVERIEDRRSPRPS